MKAKAIFRQISWVFIPLSILTGDVLIRWGGRLPEEFYTSPGNLLSTLLLSFMLWWSLSRFVVTRTNKWATSLLITLPAAVLVSVLWSFHVVLSHDMEGEIVLYFFRYPLNALSLGWSATGVLLLVLILGLWAMWTAVLALSESRKSTGREGQIFGAVTLIWLVSAMSWAPATPALGSPYMTDFQASHLVATSLKAVVQGNGELFSVSTRSRLPSVKIENMPNVLVIVGESLRVEQLGMYGYGRETTPELRRFSERFADETFWFQNASATSGSTATSLASILSGEYAIRDRDEFHGLPLVWDYAKAGGAETLMVTAQDWSWEGLFNFFAVQQPPDTVRARASFRAPNANDTGIDDRLIVEFFQNWLQEREATEQPFFAVMQLNNTHYPGLAHPAPPWPTDDPIGHYDAAVLLSDELIGRVLKMLENQRLIDNTIVVFTADHGEFILDTTGEKMSFGGGSRAMSCHPDIMNVPLMFYVPKGLWRDETLIASLRENENKTVTHLDILPTLLGLMQLEPATELSGQSLLTRLSGDRAALCFTTPGWTDAMSLGFGVADAKQAVFMRSDFREPFLFKRTASEQSTRWSGGEKPGGAQNKWLQDAFLQNEDATHYVNRLGQKHPLWKFQVESIKP